MDRNLAHIFSPSPSGWIYASYMPNFPCHLSVYIMCLWSRVSAYTQGFCLILFEVFRVLWRGCGGCGSWGGFDGGGGCEEGWDAGCEVTGVFNSHWWPKCPANSCNIDLTASLKGCKLLKCSRIWSIFFPCSCWHWRFSFNLVWHQQ